jgi:hypothetical protein
MKFNNDKIEKIKPIIERAKNSKIKVNQMLNAIRTFALPRLNYYMMNSIFSKRELDKLDLYIRKVINVLVGGLPLSKDVFYWNWKYGGLGIKNMKEIYAHAS